MKTNARRIGRLSLVAVCLVAGASRDAAADQITQRYTITELGLYTGKTWGTTPNGLISDAIQEAPGIDNTGNLRYRYGYPVDYDSGKPYSGPMPADLDTQHSNTIWSTGSAGQYTVGNYYNQAGELATFLSDGVTARTFVDATGQPHFVGYAVGVNDIGQVIVSFNGSSRVLDFHDGSIKDVISPYHNLAMAINHDGMIVGRGFDSERYFAFVTDMTDPRGSQTWLKDLIPAGSGWTLGLASGINDHGQIVGVGLDPAGKLAYYRLDPIPEPSTIVGGSLLFLAALGYRHWRRRTKEHVGSVVR